MIRDHLGLLNHTFGGQNLALIRYKGLFCRFEINNLEYIKMRYKIILLLNPESTLQNPDICSVIQIQEF